MQTSPQNPQNATLGSRIGPWFYSPTLMIILRQEWPTVTSYLISLSPLLFENIAFRVFSALWWYDDQHMIIWWSSSEDMMIIIWGYDDHHMRIWWSLYEDMMTLTCYQDHILIENIWFLCSETSYSGDERRCYWCYRCGEIRNFVKFGGILKF